MSAPPLPDDYPFGDEFSFDEETMARAREWDASPSGLRWQAAYLQHRLAELHAQLGVAILPPVTPVSVASEIATAVVAELRPELTELATRPASTAPSKVALLTESELRNAIASVVGSDDARPSRALLDRTQLAQALGVSPTSVDRMRREVGFPQLKIGDSPRFDLDAVREWLAQREQRGLRLVTPLKKGKR